MNEFHVVIHAMEDSSGEAANAAPTGPTKFSRSFEEVAEAFEQLPRMFLEPDGSFVWVSEQGSIRSQLDGLLTDNGTNLLHCELKGRCTSETLNKFLSTLGWPDQNVHFQLIREGTFLSEADFREQCLG